MIKIILFLLLFINIAYIAYIAQSQGQSSHNYHQICTSVNNPKDHHWGGISYAQKIDSKKMSGLEINLLSQRSSAEINLIKEMVLRSIEKESKNMKTKITNFGLRQYLKKDDSINGKKVSAFLDYHQMEGTLTYTILFPKIFVEVYFEPIYSFIIGDYLQLAEKQSIYEDLKTAASKHLFNSEEIEDKVMNIMLIWGAVGSSMRGFTESVISENSSDEQYSYWIRPENKKLLSYIQQVWSVFVAEIAFQHFLTTKNNYLLPKNVIVENPSDQNVSPCIIAKTYHFWLVAGVTHYLSKNLPRVEAVPILESIFQSGKGYEYFFSPVQSSPRACRPKCLFGPDGDSEVEGTRLYLALKAIGTYWGYDKNKTFNLQDAYNITTTPTIFSRPTFTTLWNYHKVENVLDERFSIQKLLNFVFME